MRYDTEFFISRVSIHHNATPPLPLPTPVNTWPSPFCISTWCSTVRTTYILLIFRTTGDIEEDTEGEDQQYEWSREGEQVWPILFSKTCKSPVCLYCSYISNFFPLCGIISYSFSCTATSVRHPSCPPFSCLASILSCVYPLHALCLREEITMISEEIFAMKKLWKYRIPVLSGDREHFHIILYSNIKIF